MDSAADEDRDLAVREHHLCLAAQQELRDPTPAMRTHDDEIAPVSSRRFEDFDVGENALYAHASA
jgi:hypothetical protein